MNITHLSGVVVTEAARSGDFFAGAPAPALTFFRPKTEAVQTVFTQKVKNFMLNFFTALTCKGQFVFIVETTNWRESFLNSVGWCFLCIRTKENDSLKIILLMIGYWLRALTPKNRTVIFLDIT